MISPFEASQRVARALATRWDASKGLITMPGARGHEYVSISDKGVRTKVGIDASLPFGFTGRYERVPVPPADLSKYTTTLELKRCGVF